MPKMKKLTKKDLEMKKYFIILALVLILAFACDIEGTIYEEIDTSNAIIQSDEPCDDCKLESE